MWMGEWASGYEERMMTRFSKVFNATCVFITLSMIFFSCGNESPTEPETPANNWRPATENVNGTLTEIQGIPLLTLWGTPYEQGYAHGYLYAPEVIENLENQCELEPDLVPFLENVMLPNLGNYTVPNAYLQELTGFLAGMEARAGGSVYVAAVNRTITLNDLIASVCIDNIDHLMGSNCTSFCVWDTLTEGGSPITGRNYDHPDNEITTGRFIFIVRKPPPGSGLRAWISVNMPGSFSCETAMNSDGVTFATQEVNVILPTSATDGFCPEFILQRLLLESARKTSVVNDVSSVLQSLYTNGGEANLMSWPSEQGVCSAVFEVDGDLTTGHGFTVRQPETGEPFLIQTNQFYERIEPTASARYSTLENYFDGIIAGSNPKLTVDKAWDLLGQVPAGGVNIIQVAVVFEPDAMRMHVAFAEHGTHATDCQRITVDVDPLFN